VCILLLTSPLCITGLIGGQEWGTTGRVSSVFGILSNCRIYSSPSTLYCRSLSLCSTNDEFSESVVWPVVMTVIDGIGSSRRSFFDTSVSRSSGRSDVSDREVIWVFMPILIDFSLRPLLCSLAHSNKSYLVDPASSHMLVSKMKC
jgi:hypothetical protein